MAHPAISALIQAARSYLGVPFRHCGADREGVDCVGLILAAMREAGMGDYRPRPYARGDFSRLLKEIERFAAPREGMPEPGDLLVMRVKGELTHCALVTDDGRIIHADERRGRVVENRLTAEFLVRVAVVYRWRAVDKCS